MYAIGPFLNSDFTDLTSTYLDFWLLVFGPIYSESLNQFLCLGCDELLSANLYVIFSLLTFNSVNFNSFSALL